jgi:hypothetical protein
MRVFVEILHVRVRRSAVEIEVVFLCVFTVVALAVGEAEEPFLENWILAVPEGQREAQALFVIGNAGDAILAPAVSARAGLIASKEIPGVTAFAIVLAHRSPLSLTEVGPPLLPVGRALAGFLQARLFLCHVELLNSSSELHSLPR